MKKLLLFKNMNIIINVTTKVELKLGKARNNLVQISCGEQNIRTRRRRFITRSCGRRVNFRALIPRLVVLLPILIFTVSMIIAATDYNAKATPQTITSPSITVTIDPASPLAFTLDVGVFNSTTQNLAVSTTSASGYTITMETGGYTYRDTTNSSNPIDQTILTTDLVNTDDPTDTTKRIKSITAPQGNNNFNNTYGYYFADTKNPPATTTWHPVPTINNQVTLKTTDSKNTTEDTYALAFGALVDSTLPTGTYQNTFVLNITANMTSAYTIKYDKNDNDATGTMVDQAIPLGVPTKLNANEFSKTGYIFTGWNTASNGTGTAYIDEYDTINGEILNTTSSGAEITLFAQWVKYCAPDKICYNDNGANSTTKMGDQSATSNTATMLWPSNFKREGYGFAGWAETDQITNTTKIYGPMETITTPDLSTNGLNLYAVWVKSTGSLQNWGGCATLPAVTYNGASGTLVANISNITALTDTRDNNTYAVAKLTDGNCWFIENLRLGATSTLSLAPDQTDTDSDITISYSTTAPSSDTARTFISVNTSVPIATMTTPTNANIYSYGNYYSYQAAIANTATPTTTNPDATTSICPKGWTLPLGRNISADKSFSVLDKMMDGTGDSQNGTTAATLQSAKWRSFPNNYIYSGVVRSSVDFRGANGWWRSATRSSDAGLSLQVANNMLMPGTTINSFSYGVTVRCIARDSYTIKYNSNGGSGDMANQTVFIGESVTLNANTFTAPTDKEFIEWNTRADGLGTAYQDSETITTSLGNKGDIVELYAIWVGSAKLDTGQNINIKMKNVAGHTTGSTLNHTNTNIKAIARANSLPANFVPSDANTISLTTSSEPVYIFFDEVDGTMYYYTKSNKIYLNANSGHFAHNLKGITDISGLSFLNASSVTSMGSMFQGASSLADINALSGWNTSSVMNMVAMFYGASSLADINALSGWNTSSVTNMGSMFRGASSLADINGASGWVTSSVTDMSFMFYETSSLADINGASGWVTSSVTNMSNMFNGASSLADINALSGWNTSSVTNMSLMFRGASSLADINGASGWVTSSVTNMGSMFSGASSLTEIDALRDWSTSSVTNMSQMFSGASSLADINGASGWVTSSVTNMSGMFQGASSLADINGASGWVTSSVTDMSYMFYNSWSLVDISGAAGWDTSSLTNITQMFGYVYNIDATVLNNWDVSKILSKPGAFVCPVDKRPSWY